MVTLMETNPLLRTWGGLWQDMLLRGLIAIIFGLLAIFLPGITITVFILLFGAFAIVDGLLLVLQSVTTRRHEAHWWVRLLQGLLSIAIGIAVFVWPGLTLLILLYIIAFYAIAGGLLQIMSAIELRKVIKGELLLLVSGILAIAIGVLLILRPGIGLIALVQTIGIFAIAYGIMIAILGLQLRSYVHKAAPA
jgi:uncharacterized membrane protein HdeD (DUF308 family)